MPTLEWIGKDKVVNHHLDVPYRVLERQYSYDADGQHEADNGSENMIIHGDNLEAIKSLLPLYEGSIDFIYIDPPYNTAHSTSDNQRWVYSDNVDSMQIKSWLGKVVGDEGEDLSRHDKWLCMMYPRLKLLHRLLSKYGVIFISIDNNELANLKMICDEIFGARNFITMFAVENNPKGRKNNNFVSEGYEHCLLYCKSKNEVNNICQGRFFNDVTDPEKQDNRSALRDEWGEFRQSKRQVSGCNKSNALCRESKSERCFTIYYCADTDAMELVDEYDLVNDEWFISDKGAALISSGYIRYVCTNTMTGKPSIPLYSKKTLIERHSEHGLYFKEDGTIYEKEREESQQITSFLPNKRFGADLMTETATHMLERIFKSKDKFNNAKNVSFIQLLVSLIKKEEFTVLDSFAGSGTTAHAVLEANKDGGNRKFILIEMMDYADSITAERVKRVISGYGSGKGAVAGTGGNFSYYELGEPLLIDGNLNEKVGVDKIREYVWFTDTKSRLPEAHPEEPYYLGIHVNSAYYFYYEQQAVTTLNREFLHTVKTKADSYVIYADLCTLSDAELERFHITFKKIPRDITKL